MPNMNALFPEVRRAFCALDGTPVPYTDNDVEDPEEDTHLPMGWARVAVQVVRPNPAWAEEQARIERLIQMRTSLIEDQVSQQIAARGGDVPEDQIIAMGEQIAAIMEASQPLPTNEEPEMQVVSYEYAVAPHNLQALGQLFEDFAEVGNE